MSGHREDERAPADGRERECADTPFEDDGHTIADMSGVDGIFGRPSRRSAPQTDEEGRFIPPFTPKERRTYALMAVGAALAIGLVFLVGLALVILLMLGIWSL